VIIDPAEDTGEPGPRSDVVELGGLDQGEHRSGTFPTSIGADEIATIRIEFRISL
jgi:hypothetical protein